MNETLVLSGLHLTVSGPRPVMPPGAKMASMVRDFLSGVADCARAYQLISKKQIVKRNGWVTD
jgi:hypothetical protein